MRRGRPPYPDLLTPREREVLDLLRRGLTNRQIAERLGISLPGARYHVSEILSKLGVETRAEAAAWEGEPNVRRLWFGAGGFGLFGDRPLWEGIMRTTSIIAIGAAATGVALIAAGVLYVSTRGGEDKSSPDDPPKLNAAGNLLEWSFGPYRLTPEDHDGDLPTIPSVTTRPEFAASSPADDIDEALDSSLFPRRLPEGYVITQANSDGEPSELFLWFVIAGPNGDIEMTRSRPEKMPVDLTYDPDTEEYEPRIIGGGGVAIVPIGGDEDTPGGRFSFFEAGVSTTLTGDGLTADELSTVYRTMAGSLREGPATAADLLPPLPAGYEVPVDSATGPCQITTAVVPYYVWEGSQVKLAFYGACTDLVATTACDPGYVGTPPPGLVIACDADGNRIDANWTMAVDGGDIHCRSGRPVYVEATTLLTAGDCDPRLDAVSGEPVRFTVCLTVRDQESCAELTYTIP